MIDKDSQLADLRSTIYWNPLLVSNAQGETSFDFYTADEPGTYEVIVEGLTINGQLGRKRYSFEVK